MRLLLEHFDDLLTTPETVDQFNAQILQWAVKGKLVPQFPNDEPASVLLEKIKAEKTKLEKEGKVAKNKSLPPICDDEIPYELPENWQWARLGDIASYGRSEKANPKTLNHETWVLNLEDIEKTSSKLLQRVRFRERPFKSAKTKFYKGDVLYGKLRPYLDKVLVADEDGVCTTEIIPINVFYGLFPHYLRLALKSPAFLDYVNEITYGVKMPRLGTTDGKMAKIPLPPFAEQHRIVEKVESLLAQTKVIKEQLIQAEEEQRKINQAALIHLTSAQDNDEFNKRWTFIKDNFDLLYTHPENVVELKQTILQLAVQGKLVPQDPNDEPASVLLERIKEEKAQLVEAGEIRKSEKLPPITEDEKPYTLPRGWEWVKLDHACTNITDGFHRTPKILEEGVPYVMATQVKPQGVDFSTNLFVSKVDHDRLKNKTNVKRGDVLVVNIGAGCGTPSIITVDFEFSFKNVAILNRPRYIETKYMFYFMLSIWKKLFEEVTQGGAQPYLSLKMIKNIPFPLPPLYEQSLIVAKVEKLFQQIDAMEKQLEVLPELHEKLVAVVLAGV